MRGVLSCAVLICCIAQAEAASQCSPDEIKAATHWSMPCFEGKEPAPVPAAAPETKLRVGVPTWLRAMQDHERLIAKAIRLGDRDEAQRQSYQLSARVNDVLKWPEDDAWNYARVYCANRAQELANYASDKLMGSARGEVAAEDSMKAYRAATDRCQKGLAKLK